MSELLLKLVFISSLFLKKRGFLILQTPLWEGTTTGAYEVWLCVKEAPLFYIPIIIVDITYVSICVSAVIADHTESW